MTAQPVRIVAYLNDQKRCSTCRKVKPVHEFGTFRMVRRRRALLYRASRCLACDAKRGALRRGVEPKPAPNPKHRDEARRLRSDGMTYREIGERLGISANVAWKHASDVAVIALNVRRSPVDEQAASDRRARALAGPSVCVCGGSRRGHVGGRGAHPKTGCPKYFERGQ